MGVEFNFDEISLDQKVSREQLEIDLYDELVTISDAEPEEQVKLLSAKPAVAVSHEGDKPESIRVTGYLGKDHSLAVAQVLPAPHAPELTEIPVAARPANVAKSQPLPAAYPPPLAAGPEFPAPPNGQKPASVQSPGPSSR